ncbi:MAG: hypothetical protein IPJ17_15675 [Holophagales bacterium]|nr:MAG: hypothetical protein IPJ17_15675 [Holophagales bacterium]
MKPIPCPPLLHTALRVMRLRSLGTRSWKSSPQSPTCPPAQPPVLPSVESAVAPGPLTTSLRFAAPPPSW